MFEIPPIRSLISFNFIWPLFYFLSLINSRTVPMSRKAYFLAICTIVSSSFFVICFCWSFMKSCSSFFCMSYSWVEPSITALFIMSLNLLKSFCEELIFSEIWDHNEDGFYSWASFFMAATSSFSRHSLPIWITPNCYSIWIISLN